MIQLKFTGEVWQHNKRRLTNQIFKLLPLYEEDGDWKKQLEAILMELKGYENVIENCPHFLVLAARLGTLLEVENRFYFRKAVFEAITSLQEAIEG